MNFSLLINQALKTWSFLNPQQRKIQNKQKAKDSIIIQLFVFMSNEKSFHFETFFTFHKNTGNYKIFVIALEKVKNFAS